MGGNSSSDILDHALRLGIAKVCGLLHFSQSQGREGRGIVLQVWSALHARSDEVGDREEGYAGAG